MAKRKKDTLGIEKGKPLVLPSGTVVRTDDNGKKVLETKEQQEERAAIEEVVADPFDDPDVVPYKRTLADVTVPTSQLNPVMLVLAYTMWGLDDNAVARLLNLSTEQVQNVMQSDLFVRMRKETLEAIRYAEASALHGYISRKAQSAAHVVASKLSSKSEDVQLAAAKDILDRAGFRPADRTEHVHRFDDELRIVHLRENEPITINTGV